MENMVHFDRSDDVQCSSFVREAKFSLSNPLPLRSKARYEDAYHKFSLWRNENNVKSLSENDILKYFLELAATIQPTSLWSRYSMLKSTLIIKDNVDISKYKEVRRFLKKNIEGHKRKKSKILTVDNINQFLTTASDDDFLLAKVVLVFGICGASQKQEMKDILMSHIEDTGSRLIVILSNTRTELESTFVINERFYPIVKKYMALRPPNSEHLPFFIKYHKGKCCRQVVGLNKFGSIPKIIAEFLGLPDAKQYTGHCFRRSSRVIDNGGDSSQVQIHDDQRSSSTDEEFIDEESIDSKTNIARTITSQMFPTERDTSSPSSTATSIDKSHLLDPLENNDSKEPPTHIFNMENISFTTNSSSKPINFIFHNCSVTINNYQS